MVGDDNPPLSRESIIDISDMENFSNPVVEGGPIRSAFVGLGVGFGGVLAFCSVELPKLFGLAVSGNLRFCA